MKLCHEITEHVSSIRRTPYREVFVMSSTVSRIVYTQIDWEIIKQSRPPGFSTRLLRERLKGLK